MSEFQCADIHPRRPRFRRWFPAGFGLLALLVTGCPQATEGPEEPVSSQSLAGVSLKLLVAGDPQIAAAAQRLQGEWTAQTGSDFQVDSISEEDLTEADTIEADALICPSYQLGVLAQRKLVSRLPGSLLPRKLLPEGADHWSDVFELQKLREVAWGDDVVAVPFGSPVLTCYYRADLLRRLGRRPPQTWAEYAELAELMSDGEALGQADAGGEPWSGTIEPLGPGWAGLVLLARAAPYARHRDNYSTLFRIDTMEPLIDGPPFVRALKELAAAAKLGPQGQLQYDPADARTTFWKGRCGMALSWPTAAVALQADGNIEVGLAELPGSAEVYNVGNQAWESRSANDDPRVPLLAVAGRVGVVSATTAHGEAAFQLLFWLSGEQLSPQVCSATPATTLFRRSHLDSPLQWVEKPIPLETSADYAKVTEATFLRQQCIFALRIPGRAEYVAALDEAVHRTINGDQPPPDALNQAASRWRGITQKYGVQEQKVAYLSSLGVR